MHDRIYELARLYLQDMLYLLMQCMTESMSCARLYDAMHDRIYGLCAAVFAGHAVSADAMHDRIYKLCAAVFAGHAVSADAMHDRIWVVRGCICRACCICRCNA